MDDTQFALLMRRGLLGLATPAATDAEFAHMLCAVLTVLGDCTTNHNTRRAVLRLAATLDAQQPQPAEPEREAVAA